MFNSLSEKLGGILDRLTRRGALHESDVDEALREVRRALLEADVALDVARAFTDNIKKQAIGVEVMKSVTPGQMVVKIVHDQLVATLGADSQGINLNAAPPVAIMMVRDARLGKTTTTAKVARRLADRQKKKVLMASLDVRRPAAMEQLAVLGREGQTNAADRRRPAAAANRAARDRGRQARRLRRRAARHRGPHHARRRDDERGGRGQARRQSARSAAGGRQPDRPGRSQSGACLQQRVGLTGIVLTRVDGDGRGGAALSMRAVTNKPIKLIGTGEKLDALEEFDPGRIAGRILGMGDIVALVEKAAANMNQEKAMRAAEKMRKGQFDLADMREQLSQMAAMGGIGGLMGMMPGVAKMKNQIANAGLDDKILKRQMAIINSMTPRERRNPIFSRPAARNASPPLRHHAGSDQQAFENASRHGRHDEGDGQRQTRPARGARPDDGLWWRRAADAGTDRGTRQEDAGRNAQCRRAFADDAEYAAEFPRYPGLARAGRKVSWIAGASRSRKEEVINSQKSVCKKGT